LKRILIPVVCALLFPALATHPAAAQENGGQASPVKFKIAIIDMEAIRLNAAAVKDIRDQIGKYRKEFQDEIQQEENKLREANQELARQRTILSPEAFAEERRKFEQRLLDAQRLARQLKQELVKSNGLAMREVQASLNVIVVNIAQENGLTLVLQKKQTVLVANDLDITKMVMDRLDAKLPSVKVSDPRKAETEKAEPGN